MRIGLGNFRHLLSLSLSLVLLSAESAQTSYFIYDEAGHVIGEYDANGNPVQEHIYLGDKPVAVVQNNTTMSYVTTDQLNTPRVITDSNQSVVWQWNSDPFGNGSPTGSLTYNLRFPGQYYDAETGKNYNYYRDYDPAVGRYIESDPFGLKGGINTYGYVSENPLTRTDPYGLSECHCVADSKLSDLAITDWQGQKRLVTCRYRCTRKNGTEDTVIAKHTESYSHPPTLDDGREGNCIGQQYHTRQDYETNRFFYDQTGFGSFDPESSDSAGLKDWAKTKCSCGN